MLRLDGHMRASMQGSDAGRTVCRGKDDTCRQRTLPHGHAADHIGVHVDGEGLHAGVLGQHRQDEAQPVAVHAVGHPHRRRALLARDPQQSAGISASGQ